MLTYETDERGIITAGEAIRLIPELPNGHAAAIGFRIAKAQHQATLEWAKGQVAAVQNPFAEYTEQHTLFENAIQKVLENFIRKRLGDLREKDA